MCDGIFKDKNTVHRLCSDLNPNVVKLEEFQAPELIFEIRKLGFLSTSCCCSQVNLWIQGGLSANF